ncbi:MAG TPA: VacB/RNase II family 3'-5' exoribonuclease, partial [Candidatus Methylacidiphilales bacterium]
MIDSDTLHALLASDRYQPVDAAGLAKKLKVKDADRPAFLSFLADEEREGRVVAAKHGKYALPERLGLLAGRIAVNERGFGFVIPDDPDHADVRIGGGNLGTAMHNDRVLIRLHAPGGRGFGKDRGRRREEKPEGEVTRVLKRARTQIVGTLERSRAAWYVRPDDARILHDVCVPPPFDGGKPVPAGFKVVAKLKEWTSPHVSPEGEVTEVLGPAGKEGVDILSIIRKHELPGEFPAAALAEADRIPDAVRPADLEGREDFRGDFVLTIDPDDAKDFDDALSYKVLPGGDLEVAIHIADVSHYVRPGGALDAEARLRGNSVYLVDRVIPMLPEKLSNGLCSLRPDVDRLVKTVVVRLGKGGRVGAVRFASGVIHSRKRLTYQEAYRLIQNPVGPLGKHLSILGDMAMALRRARFAQGALNLDFPEVKVRLDAHGKPTAIEKIENDASHQLIEEYMLLANEAVARKLTHEGRPAVHRVHETPDPERLRELRVQLVSLGIPVGDLTQRGEIGKLLDRSTGTPEEAVVKTNLLRSLKRAVYSEKPLGHFGLAKKHYAHFTSPIRRYSDLLVHRALISAYGFGDDGLPQEAAGAFEAT